VLLSVVVVCKLLLVVVIVVSCWLLLVVVVVFCCCLLCCWRPSLLCFLNLSSVFASCILTLFIFRLISSLLLLLFVLFALMFSFNLIQ